MCRSSRCGQRIGKVRAGRDVEHRHRRYEPLRDRDSGLESVGSCQAVRARGERRDLGGQCSREGRGGRSGLDPIGSRFLRLRFRRRIGSGPRSGRRRGCLSGRLPWNGGCRRLRFRRDRNRLRLDRRSGARRVGRERLLRDSGWRRWPRFELDPDGRDRRSESDDGGRCDRDGPRSQRATHEGPLPLANEGRRQRPLLRSPFAVYGAAPATSRRFTRCEEQGSPPTAISAEGFRRGSGRSGSTGPSCSRRRNRGSCRRRPGRSLRPCRAPAWPRPSPP